MCHIKANFSRQALKRDCLTLSGCAATLSHQSKEPFRLYTVIPSQRGFETLNDTLRSFAVRYFCFLKKNVLKRPKDVAYESRKRCITLSDQSRSFTDL